MPQLAQKDTFKLITLPQEYGRCAQCKDTMLSEYYRCIQCTQDVGPLGYVLCPDCVGVWGREAHIQRRGSNHQFELARSGKWCDTCMEEIKDDYLTCTECDLTPGAFLLCMRCASRDQFIAFHTRDKGIEHTFKHMSWAPSVPIKEARVISVFDPHTNEKFSWGCSECASMIHGDVYRCIECGTYDCCDHCGEVGKMAIHAKETGHHFIALRPKEATIAPPAYEA